MNLRENHTNPYIVSGQAKKTVMAKVVTTDKAGWHTPSKYKWVFWLVALMSAAILLASCKGNSSSSEAVNPSDTAGLAAFNAQKAADSAAALNNEQQPGGQNSAGESRQSYTSGAADNADGDGNSGAVKSINDDNSGSNTDGNSAGSVASGDESGATGNSAEATTAKKKRFSNAAKGALIGAGSGAVVGAVVAKKNRGLGAVIGAAVGGGAGYGIGKHKDNKKAKEGQ